MRQRKWNRLLIIGTVAAALNIINFDMEQYPVWQIVLMYLSIAWLLIISLANGGAEHDSREDV